MSLGRAKRPHQTVDGIAANIKAYLTDIILNQVF
jgi:hypothetical protein